MMLAGGAGAVELRALRRSPIGAVHGDTILSRLRAKPVTPEILRHWREAVPNDRLAHLVKDAARGLARALQMRLTEHAVAYGHWAFLRILWESEGLTQRQLSGEAGVMEPTTFAALNTMERLGYVVRRPNPKSRKEVLVYLTPKGRALKNKLVPLAEEVNAVALRGVGVVADDEPVVGVIELDLFDLKVAGDGGVAALPR